VSQFSKFILNVSNHVNYTCALCNERWKIFNGAFPQVTTMLISSDQITIRVHL
jgi:hypothetical protein